MDWKHMLPPEVIEVYQFHLISWLSLLLFFFSILIFIRISYWMKHLFIVYQHLFVSWMLSSCWFFSYLLWFHLYFYLLFSFSLELQETRNLNYWKWNCFGKYKRHHNPSIKGHDCEPDVGHHLLFLFLFSFFYLDCKCYAKNLSRVSWKRRLPKNR